jgi:tRNA pseudouridine55 synthase
MSLDGILLVDKPEGVSSAAVVRDVKRRLGAAKVGHLGTLDPFASGLLPLCVDEGAKVVAFLNEEGKSYEGTIRLGVATDTLDRTGTETAREPVPAVDDELLRRVARTFLGAGEQVPPMYSALKRKGVRLYELARRGIEVEREPRRIRIERFEVRRLDPERIDFAVDGSKGLYVRTLAADLARALGTVGHLESLRRTRFGSFAVEDAIALDAIAPGRPLPLRSPREALSARPEIEVDRVLERKLRAGQQWALRDLRAPEPGETIAKLIGEGGDLVGILAVAGARWSIDRILRPKDRPEGPSQPSPALPSS